MTRVFVEEKRKRNKLAEKGREFYYDYGDNNDNTDQYRTNDYTESDRIEQRQRSSFTDMASTRMSYYHERQTDINSVPLATKPKIDTFTPTFSIPEGMIIVGITGLSCTGHSI